MQELERMINVYHTLFLVFLILGLLLLAASVFLFFRFDIRKIFDMKTGREQKRTIQKMEELNDKTGKLHPDMVVNTPSQLKAEERIEYPVTEQNPGIHETTPLNVNMEETTVLSQNQQERVKTPERNLPGTFKIEKEVMWVHTQEVL